MRSQEQKYKRFIEISNEQAMIYISKNKDYGDSFSISVKEHGLIAAIVRLEDKWLRFKRLAKGNQAQVTGESIIDTLRDISNYCLMTIMELEEMQNEHESISIPSCSDNK